MALREQVILVVLIEESSFPRLVNSFHGVPPSVLNVLIHLPISDPSNTKIARDSMHGFASLNPLNRLGNLSRVERSARHIGKNNIESQRIDKYINIAKRSKRPKKFANDFCSYPLGCSFQTERECTTKRNGCMKRE